MKLVNILKWSLLFVLEMNSFKRIAQFSKYSPFNKRLLTISKASNFYDLSEADLINFLAKIQQPKFRAQQIRSWVYSKGVLDFNLMLDLPAALRSCLQSEYTFGSLEIALEQLSKDGTYKRAYRLHDGQLIESVLMPYEDGRRTACISSQAGCAMVGTLSMTKLNIYIYRQFY